MRTQLAAAVTVATLIGASWAMAQHQHARAPNAEPPHPADTRALVALPGPMADHMLANMRDHLVALQEIQDALARDLPDKAAEISELRLGMTSLATHGAHEIAQFMPQGMQDAGSAMHRAASQFTIIAKNAGVTGDLKSALGALSVVTAQCVGCHAGYRVR
jgi:hypothetical protein